MSQAQVLAARPTLTDEPVRRPSEIVIAGRRVSPTVVFDTYWRFAARRQAVYEAELLPDDLADAQGQVAG
jgi:hypothetical protein